MKTGTPPKNWEFGRWFSLSLFDFAEEFRVPLVLLFSTRIGFSRFWGQISMLGAQNMTHQRVMNLWKPRIMLKDYLLGLYRKKIIGKVYFNTQHLPPKTFQGWFATWIRSHPRSISRDPGHDRNCAGSPPQTLYETSSKFVDRERHCIWFSYPLELPGIIRSYESYVIHIFWKNC